MKSTILSLLVVCFTILGTAQKINTALTYSVKLPAEISNKTPVLVLLHGYGSNEADLLDIADQFEGRFIAFSVRAPYTTSNGGFSWYDVEFMNDYEMKYDYNQVKKTREQLLSFVSNACKAFNVDSTQVFYLGFSQGAIMAYELGITAPKRMQGIMTLSGRLLSETKTSSADWTSVGKLKIFIAHGQSDNVIKYSDSEMANNFFKEKKVKHLTFKKYEMSHSISGTELNDIKYWLLKSIEPTQKNNSK